MSRLIKKTSPTPEKLFADALAQEDFSFSFEDMRLLIAGLHCLRGQSISHMRIDPIDLRTCRPLSTDKTTRCRGQADKKTVVN